MSVFETLKNTKEFDDYVKDAQQELEVSNEESKQIYIVARTLVHKLLNSDGYISDEGTLDLYAVSDYMTGALIVGMASRDEIIKDAKEFEEKYDGVLSEDKIVEDVN